MSARLRLGVLISGGGRTLLNLADHIEGGGLRAEIGLTIASRPDCAGVERARARGLAVQVVAGRAQDPAVHDAVTRALRGAAVELVCLAGYLRWLRVDPPFNDRVINIHPALLPEFGGPGMYGLRVHRAVLAAGRRVSGCTVHYVDGEYDHGPVILQRTCPVLPDDDAHTLAERVFAEECIAYPQVVQAFAEGRVRLTGGRVELLARAPG